MFGKDGKRLHDTRRAMARSSAFRTRPKSESFFAYTDDLTARPLPVRLRRTRSASSQADGQFDGSAYLTEQVFFESKDGTRVPMFITRRKDSKLDGPSDAALWLRRLRCLADAVLQRRGRGWLERGGIYAVANLRGGGEYGETGTTRAPEQKQTVFDDFIAAPSG